LRQTTRSFSAGGAVELKHRHDLAQALDATRAR